MQSACNPQVQLPIERHSIGNQSPSSRHPACTQHAISLHSARTQHALSMQSITILEALSRHQARHSAWHSAHLRVPIRRHAASASAYKLLLMLQDPDEGGNQIGCDQHAIRLLMLSRMSSHSACSPSKNPWPFTTQSAQHALSMHSACTQHAKRRNQHALSAPAAHPSADDTVMIARREALA